ncbi:hypothetical protein KEM54_001730 [Ascosphaera aggregata]|nr:hypothetical protein KEM54_001730 [Ascosphaera aggregata]
MDEHSSATVQEAQADSLSTSTASSPLVDNIPSQKPSLRPMSPHSTPGSDAPSAPSSKDGPDVHNHAATERLAKSYSGQSSATKKVNVSSGISKRIEALKMMSGNGNGGHGAGNYLSPHTHSNVAAFERMRKRTSDNISARLSINASRPASPTSEFLANQRRLSSLPAEKLRGRPSFVPQRLVLESRAVTPSFASPPENYTSSVSRPLSRPRTQDDSSTLTRTPSMTSMSIQSPQLDPVTGGIRRPGTASPATTSTSNSLSGEITLSGTTEVDRPQSSESNQAGDETERTSHFTRRKSTAGTGIDIHKRRSSVASIVSTFNLPSPTKTENEPHPIAKAEVPQADSKSKTVRAVDIGEVNIHFPDTLLWKRRNLRVDEEGYILLIAPITGGYKAPVKKYHISQFRAPRMPELDEEELPYSIILNFIQGGDALQA